MGAPATARSLESSPAGGASTGARIVLRRQAVAAVDLLEVAYPSAQRFAPHEHPRAYLCLVVHGGMREDYCRREREARQGQVLFYPAGASHAGSPGPQGGRIFHVGLSEQLGDGLSLEGPAVFDVSASPAPLTMGLTELLYREFLVQELTGALSGRSVRSASGPGWMRRVRARLHEEFEDPPTLGEIASEVGVHPAHLAREYRRRYHCMVGESTRRLRVSEAARQLRGSDLSLSAVACRAGFSDQSHFGRVFKRYMGQTPMRYRQTRP